MQIALESPENTGIVYLAKFSLVILTSIIGNSDISVVLNMPQII